MIRPDEIAALAAVPAPTGAEEARMRWLEQRIAGLPGIRSRDAVGNLIWQFSSDPPELLVMAHVDTVFGADTTLTILRDGDDLVGPGVGDNAAALVAVIWALEAMPHIPSRLAVAFTVGEEGLGNLRGALHACAELRPAAVIALEGHRLDEVITEHVGSVRAKVTIAGPGGHSWWDRGTPSATHALVELAYRFVRDGANVATLRGGDAVNAIAASAEMMVEQRSLDESRLAAFAAQLHGLVLSPPLKLECEILGRRGAGRMAADHPMVAAVGAVRRGLGLPDRSGSGSTDANAAIALGIPALALGCSRGSGMHTLQERIGLESLQLGVRQVGEVIRAVLG